MYSIYGSNNCMNIVSATADEPEAVLIRAIEPIEGIAIMTKMIKGMMDQIISTQRCSWNSAGFTPKDFRWLIME